MAALIPPILLVRLKSRSVNGLPVGESRRVCHLVPVPDSAEIPQALRAYCGAEILPGAGELLDGVRGMPCERCLARSPIPAFAILRTLPAPARVLLDPGSAMDTGRDVVGWWDLGLRPEQKITARFVLLLLLQDPARDLSVAEIAVWLGCEVYTVNLIMLLHAAAGWVQPTTGMADRPWVECCNRLTERGAPLARRMLATSLTSTFTVLATRLGLDTTVVSTKTDQTSVDGYGSRHDAAPAEHPPSTTGNPQLDEESTP